MNKYALVFKIFFQNSYSWLKFFGDYGDNTLINKLLAIFSWNWSSVLSRLAALVSTICPMFYSSDFIVLLLSIWKRIHTIFRNEIALDFTTTKRVWLADIAGAFHINWAEPYHLPHQFTTMPLQPPDKINNPHSNQTEFYVIPQPPTLPHKPTLWLIWPCVLAERYPHCVY